MKSVIIVFLLALTISLTALTGCKKDSGYMNNAELTGYDYRSNLCAGAFFLKFQTGTNTYGDSIYDVTNTVTQMGLTSTDTFPILIKLNWSTNNQYCGYKLITITSFQRQ